MLFDYNDLEIVLWIDSYGLRKSPAEIRYG